MQAKKIKFINDPLKPTIIREFDKEWNEVIAPFARISVTGRSAK